MGMCFNDFGYGHAFTLTIGYVVFVRVGELFPQRHPWVSLSFYFSSNF